jgi:hypothetical protein
MQKTACTHIAKLLSKTVGGAQIKPKHSWLTDHTSNKMVMGSMRNPWDWYVSLWAYGSNEKGGLFDRLTKKSTTLGLKRMGLGRFRDGLHEIRKPTSLWEGSYGDPFDALLFRRWLHLVMNPARHRDLGERYSESSISEFAGFMTYRYCKLYLKDFFKEHVFNGIKSVTDLERYDAENNLIDLLVRTESLESDLVEALQTAGHSLTDQMVDIIYEASKSKVNKSARKKMAHYYDEATVELVRNAEVFLIEKYGYKPPCLAEQE